MAVCFSNMSIGSCNMTDDSGQPIARSATKCDAVFIKYYRVIN
jgi:hypothetical protein